MPIKPRTMEGKNPRSSRIGFRSSRIGRGAVSDTKTAMRRLKGTASREDSPVTARVAAMRGNMPKTGGFSAGYHKSPRNSSFSVTLLSTGSPSRKRKYRMKSMTSIPALEIPFTMAPGSLSFMAIPLSSLNWCSLPLPGEGAPDALSDPFIRYFRILRGTNPVETTTFCPSSPSM